MKRCICAGAMVSVACTGTAPNLGDVDSAQEAIIGGTLDTTHKAVVKLTSAGGLCSGTVVKLDVATRTAWIVTAAHCLTDPAVAAINTAVLQTTDGRSVSAPIIQTFIHPRWNFNTSPAGTDVAVVVASGAPSNVPTIALGSTNDALGIGSAVTAIGFGQTSNVSPISGVRKQLVRHVSALSSDRIHWLQIDGDGACFGDSGGAVLFNNRLVGVIHGLAWGPCTGPFVGPADAERLSDSLSFINSALRTPITLTCDQCQRGEELADPIYASSVSSAVTNCYDQVGTGSLYCEQFADCATRCTINFPAGRARQNCALGCNQNRIGSPEFETLQRLKCEDRCEAACAREGLCLVPGPIVMAPRP